MKNVEIIQTTGKTIDEKSFYGENGGKWERKK